MKPSKRHLISTPLLKGILAVPLIWMAGSYSQANSLVQFRTVLGDLDVELYDQDKPVTVANFKRYVSEGLYHNSFFHRAVHNFVIQGGGFFVSDRGTTKAQIAAIPTFPPITNEFGVGPFYSNLAGTLAMAKTADPNSATSQFYLNLTQNNTDLAGGKGLDAPTNSGGFVVFGRVVSDTNVLSLLNSFVGFRTPATNVIVNAKGVFSQLPLLFFNVTNPSVQLEDLVFVDISLLAVQVTDLSGDLHEISWNSSVDGTNHVEFTTTFPPNWQVLTNLVAPPKGRSRVIDPTPDPLRFYRVRVSH